jgi:IS5 family transposase
LVDFQVTQAMGIVERDMAPLLLDEARERGFRARTLGADERYDTRECVAAMRKRKVTPQVAQITIGRRSAIDGRTTSWPGDLMSQRVRMRMEEVFGWMKTVGGCRRTRYRGVSRTQVAGYLVATAYNLVRVAWLVLKPTTG